MATMEDREELSTLTVTRSKRPSESEEQFILFNILTVMARHLNLKEIGMWLIEEKVLSRSDYEKFIKMRDSYGASTSDTVTELASMVYRNGTLIQFIKALERSSSDEVGHETILEAIRRRQEQCCSVDGTNIDTQTVEHKGTDLETNESMRPPSTNATTIVSQLLKLLDTLKATDLETRSKLSSVAETDDVFNHDDAAADKILDRSLSANENKTLHNQSTKSCDQTTEMDITEKDSVTKNPETSMMVNSQEETVRSEILELIPGQLRERRPVHKTSQTDPPSPGVPNVTVTVPTQEVPNNFETNNSSADISQDSNQPSSIQNDISHETVTTVDADNVMHVTNPSLFQTTFPYKLFHQRRAWIEIVIAVFLVYQMLASILITLCEEKCVDKVFMEGRGLDIMELVRRLCLFTMRVAVRVVIPFVFYRQLCRLAEGERRYLSRLKAAATSSSEDASSESCSSTLLHEASPNNPPTPRRKVTVTLWSSIVPHAVLFSVLLLCIGAFLIAEDRLMERSICIKKLFQVEVPFLGLQACQFCDCLAVFFMLMMVGIIKDCYCLENNSSAAKEHFDVMRKRWILMDMFCYITPFFLLVFTMCMFAFGNPLVPDPPKDVDTEDLIMWCFWTMALTLLQFCGSAARKFLKICCITGHITCILLIIVCTFVEGFRVEKIQIPPGSGVILLYTMLAVTLINFLYCLMKCHLHVKGWSSPYFRFSVLCMFVLCSSLLATAVRESIYFAYFILVL